LFVLDTDRSDSLSVDMEIKMNEAEYQAKLIRKIRDTIPGSIVIKNDSSLMPGIPDLLVLYEDRWAMLEVKMSNDSSYQPNQDYYIDLFSQMSYASFIFPEIEEEVLYDLQFSFGLVREARLS
jgi:hypothetical protein